MQYLNLELSTLDSVEFVGSEPVDQATWLKLQRYCAGQENGGLIPHCREWKDRKCQQLLRITRAELLRDCDLWTWEGDSLRLFAYPVDQEAKVIRKRDIARTNGQLGGRPAGNPAGTEIGIPHGTEIGSHIGSETGTHPESVKEGKGKEGKGNTTTTARDAELLIAAYARPSHDRDALEAAADTLRRFAGQFTFDQIRQAVAAVTHLVREWPADERATYLPTAANFFRGDLWRRHPDEWKSRRDPKRRLAADKATDRPTLTPEEIRRRLGGRADEDAA